MSMERKQSNWPKANTDAKSASPKTRNTWSPELQNAVTYLQSIPAGKLEELLLAGRQNSANRKGGEFNDFARNHAALIRLAYGMKDTTTYDWGRVKQAFANKRLRQSKR